MAAAIYPYLTLSASAAAKSHWSIHVVDRRAHLATHSAPTTATRLLLYRANKPRLPTIYHLPVHAFSSSDINVDPEMLTFAEEYNSSYPYSSGSFDGDASSSSSPLLNERLEVASQLSESVPSSSAERLEEGGSGDGSNGNSGDSGDSGSGGGGHSGGEGDDESSKNKKVITSQKITLAYAALIAMGGAIGYLKSKSTKSLISGVGSGLALLIVYSQLPTNPVFASSLGLGISALLLFVMGSRFKNSGKFFPAGIVSIASFIMTGGYIHGIMRSSHA